MQLPRDVVYLPDDTVALLELFPAKLVRLNLAGEPLGDVRLGVNRDAAAGGITAAGQCIYRGGALLLSGQYASQTETGQKRVLYLCGLSLDGQEQVRYCESRMELDFNDLCCVERELSPHCHLASAVGPDGRVYFPQAWDRYAIEVRHADGGVDGVIERAFANRMRTEDELRRISALYDPSTESTPFEVRRVIEPQPAVIAGLEVMARGDLWVLHSRSGEGFPAGIMQRCDVFDPEGRYLREVFPACEGDAELDGIEFLGDGRLLLIKAASFSAMARTDLGSVPLDGEEEVPPIEIIC